MNVFKSIIDRLTSINFWTIIGSLIAVVTAGVTLYQHSSIEIVPRMVSVPLNDEETVLFVLYNYDQTNSDSISFGWPINFYNPSKKAIELEYTINSKGCTYFNIPGYNRYKTHNAITILREESTPAIIQFKASREEIDEKGRLEGDFRLFWHYENMSDRNKVLFHYVLFPFNDSTANYVIQEDWVIRFINDGNENGHFSLLKIWKTE